MKISITTVYQGLYKGLLKCVVVELGNYLYLQHTSIAYSYGRKTKDKLK